MCNYLYKEPHFFLGKVGRKIKDNLKLVSPEKEVSGHCPTLQVWAENGYKQNCERNES